MSRLIFTVAVLTATAAHGRTLTWPHPGVPNEITNNGAAWLPVTLEQVGVGLTWDVRDWNEDNRWWIAPGNFWITRDSLDNLGIANGPWITYHDISAFAAAESLTIEGEYAVKGPGRNGTQVFRYNGGEPVTLTAFRAPEPSGGLLLIVGLGACRWAQVAGRRTRCSRRAD